MDTLVAFILHIRSQTKFWHWQTKSYELHVALENYYESIDGLTDRLVETMLGLYPRPVASPNTPVFTLQNGVHIQQFYVTLYYLLLKLSKELASVPDIQNIILDFAGETRKLLYSLTLV